MWQNITRGFRESFSRGLNFGRNKNVRVQSEQPKTKLYQYNTPCLLQTSWKSNTCQQECGSKEDGPHGKDYKSYGAYDAFDSWLGAVSCSSALALGWALSQPSHLKRWLRCQKTGVQKKGFAKYWTHLAVAQPAQSAVPQSAQPAVPEPTQPGVSPLNSDQENIREQAEDEHSTASAETLNEIRERHVFLSGALENKQAIELLNKKGRKRKDETKAFKLLKNAAEKNYGPAAYNLGICYQLGIGTEQDIVEAREWYSLAANLEHPTATYNLAVFYGKGMGGLTVNTAKGMELLQKAANLGEPNAVKALGLEEIPDCLKEESAIQKSPAIYEMKHSEEFYKSRNIICDEIDAAEIREASPEEIPLEEDEDDETYKFWTPKTAPWDARTEPGTDSTPLQVATSSNPNENIKLASSVETSPSNLPIEPKTDSKTASPKADISSNANEIFRLASSFENSPCVNTDQPYLTLHLYKMAAELGHIEAKSKYKMLLAYDSVDLLTEYVSRGSRPSIDYYSNVRLRTSY